MGLKKTVKAGLVTHLTDARFFASFDINYIGFCFDPKSDAYISPQEALAIKGWITGPKIVAEFSNQDIENIVGIIEFLEPDIVELDSTYDESEEKIVLEKGIKVARKISFEDRENIDGAYEYIYLYDALDKSFTDERFMLDLTGRESSNQSVFHIKGTPEDATGVKVYDELADLLESWLVEEE